MIISGIKSVCTVSAILVIILAGPFKGNAFSKSMVPEGLVIEETFRAGFGEHGISSAISATSKDN